MITPLTAKSAEHIAVYRCGPASLSDAVEHLQGRVLTISHKRRALGI